MRKIINSIVLINIVTPISVSAMESNISLVPNIKITSYHNNYVSEKRVPGFNINYSVKIYNNFFLNLGWHYSKSKTYESFKLSLNQISQMKNIYGIEDQYREYLHLLQQNVTGIFSTVDTLESTFDNKIKENQMYKNIEIGLFYNFAIRKHDILSIGVSGVYATSQIVKELDFKPQFYLGKRHKIYIWERNDEVEYWRYEKKLVFKKSKLIPKIDVNFNYYINNYFSLCFNFNYMFTSLIGDIPCKVFKDNYKNIEYKIRPKNFYGQGIGVKFSF